MIKNAHKILKLQGLWPIRASPEGFMNPFIFGWEKPGFFVNTSASPGGKKPTMNPPDHTKV